MEIVVAVCALLGAWLWFRARSADDVARRAKTIFEDGQLAVHFPSMTAVHTGFAPVVARFQACRFDGPAWALRGHRAAEWRAVDDGVAARIETAYQRFLRSDADTRGQDQAWFLETVRRWVTDAHGACAFEGEKMPSIERVALRPRAYNDPGSKDCPVCGLCNPASALVCDCKHRF